jgi:Tfp pilus assembly protein PilN
MTFNNIFNIKLAPAWSMISDKIAFICNWMWRVLRFNITDAFLIPGKTLCISIEKGSIAIVHGSRFLSFYKVKHFKKYPVEEDRYPRPDEIVDAIQTNVSELSNQPIKTIIVIPAEWVFKRAADFPITIKENVPEAVRFELDRLTPLNAEDAYYDYHVAGEQNGRLNVIINVTKRKLINEYRDVLKRKGIDVKIVTPSTSATNTLIRYLFKKQNYIFVARDKRCFSGEFCVDGESAHLFLGESGVEDSESVAEAIVEEIKPIMRMIKKTGKTIHFITSDDNITDLGLGRRISIPEKKLTEIIKKFKLSEKVTNIPYTVLGGLVGSLQRIRNTTNLLSNGTHDSQKAPFLVTGILFLLIVGLMIANVIAPMNMEEERLREIERQMMTLKDEVGKVEAIRKQKDMLYEEVETIREFKDSNYMMLTFVKELTSIIPKTSWLSRIRITEDKVHIEGYSMSSPADLLQKMEESDYLRKVEFASPTFRDRGMNADKFVIMGNIEGLEVEDDEKKE